MALLLTGLAGCELEPDLMEELSGAQAPDFTLPDLDGGSWQLQAHRGQTLLINFWATWCKPCRQEMPALSRLHEKMAGRDFQVIGIHVGPSEHIPKFLQETPVSFTILLDAGLSLQNWEVPVLPATFLIDVEGRAHYVAFGEREWDSQAAVDFFTAHLKD